MTMGKEEHSSLVVKESIFCKNRERKNHFINLCLAVTSYTKDFFRQII